MHAVAGMPRRVGVGQRVRPGFRILTAFACFIRLVGFARLVGLALGAVSRNDFASGERRRVVLHGLFGHRILDFLALVVFGQVREGVGPRVRAHLLRSGRFACSVSPVDVGRGGLRRFGVLRGQHHAAHTPWIRAIRRAGVLALAVVLR